MTRLFRVSALLQDHDVIGVLKRPIPVQVVDVSESGCLIESPWPIEPGITCTLRVDVAGTQVFTTGRATRRAQADRRGTVYRVGVEFLWTDQEMRLAFRRALRTLRGATDSATALADMREAARPPGPAQERRAADRQVCRPETATTSGEED